MTRHLLSLALLLFFCTSHGLSQNYFPAPEDNPRWIVYRSSFWEGGAISEVVLEYGDAVTHCGRTYHEVLQLNEFEGEEFSYLLGFVRIEGPKVYVMHDNYLDCDSGEALLYDFSLPENATATCGYNMPTQWGYLSTNEFEVRDIFQGAVGGQQRQIMDIRYDRYPNHQFEDPSRMFWIEGIGSNKHPFYPLACIGDHCEIEDSLGQVFFGEDLVFDILTYQEEVEEEAPLKVFPTVFSNQVTIEQASLSDTQLNLISATGQSVYQFSGIFDRRSLELSHLPAGVYFLRLSNTGKRSTQVVKLLKQ